MIKKQSTASNFIFQILYQCMILIVPLIVAPYLTRTLGSTALGTYTYVYSIAYYFLIFANLGIAKYGQRTIAETRGDEIALRKCFWSLLYNHIISSLVALVAYAVLILAFVRADRQLFLIHFIYVASALFDISWLFYGLENFRSIAIKNIFIRVADTICLFMFVKAPEDLEIYTLIMCASTLLGNLIMIPQAVRVLRPIRVSWKEIQSHTVPLIYFMITVLAITLYSVFNKTMLGMLATKESVAYYEYADKIIGVPRTLISVISTVLFPKVCFLVNQNRIKESQAYLKLSITVTSIASFASIFGILAVAKEFSVIYYGTDFAETGKIMMAMSPLIYILSLGNIIRLQYIIPNHQDKIYIICACFNAMINLAVGFALIPRIGVYGAICASMCAELFGLVFQMIYSRRYIPFKLIVCRSAPFVLIGALMYLTILLISSSVPIGISGLLAKVCVGAVVYMVLTVGYLLILCPERMEYRNIMYKRFKR